MNAMKVNKGVITSILYRNREAHASLFTEAQAVFRAVAIEELAGMLKDAVDGKAIRRRINLSPPEDHTADYDKMLGLLNISDDAQVDLTIAEYDCYVNDNWHWAQHANRKNAAYASNNLNPMFVGEDATFGRSY